MAKSVLDKLKAKRQQLLEAQKQTSKDQDANGDNKPYNVATLGDKEAWLSRLPPTKLSKGVITDDGELNADNLEAAMQRAVYVAMQTVGTEMAKGFQAQHEELKDYVTAAIGDQSRSMQEQGLEFFPDDPLKERLAQHEYRVLSEEYGDTASVEELRDATLEVLSAATMQVTQSEDAAAAENATPPAYQDLLDGYTAPQEGADAAPAGDAPNADAAQAAAQAAASE